VNTTIRPFVPAIALAIMLIMYIVGVFGHAIAVFRPIMITLTPWILLVFALITIAFTVASSRRDRSEKRRILIWFSLTWAATFTLEVLGVKTGKVFGEYSYGGTLGPMLFDVPVIIGLNWCIIVFGIAETLRLKRFSLLAALVGVPAGAVFFDYFLEPVAMSSLDYWSWTGGAVPLQNYAAWAIISFVFALLYFFMMPIPLPDRDYNKPAADGTGKRRALDMLAYRSDKYFPGIYVALQFLFIFLLNRLLPVIG
jgi:putative membrane protein